jgi:chaperonin GroEL (HSP60 family)
LKQCLNLLSKGVHPTTISEALHKASEKAVEVSSNMLRCSPLGSGYFEYKNALVLKRQHAFSQVL